MQPRIDKHLAQDLVFDVVKREFLFRRDLHELRMPRSTDHGRYQRAAEVDVANRCDGIGAW